MPSNRFNYRAEPDAVAGARRSAIACAKRAGAAAELCERIALATSEAVTNAVIHAYREPEKKGAIDLEIGLDSNHQLVVRVRDWGSGMTPRADSPGLGLGLPLIGRVADSFELAATDGGGTEVCMRFRLAPAAAA